MSVPNEPVMLLSYVNTQLRDFYPSLSELCRAMDLDMQAVEEKLSSIGYEYDEGLNKFV